MHVQITRVITPFGAGTRPARQLNCVKCGVQSTSNRVYSRVYRRFSYAAATATAAAAAVAHACGDAFVLASGGLLLAN